MKEIKERVEALREYLYSRIGVLSASEQTKYYSLMIELQDAVSQLNQPKESESVEGLAQLFRNNSDCYTAYDTENDETDLEQAMTQLKFIEVVSKLTQHKAKEVSDFQKELDKAYQKGFTDGNSRDRRF